jgi:hypothetical protein
MHIEECKSPITSDLYDLFTSFGVGQGYGNGSYNDRYGYGYGNYGRTTQNVVVSVR